MARRRSNPVNRHWTGFSASSLALGAGTSSQLVLAAVHDRETIMRTRGSLVCFTNGTQAPTGLTQVSVGLILVPEGTGTTTLWTPFTDADAPWFYYSTFFIGYEEPVTDVIQVGQLSGYREVIDSKAMRRVRNQEVQLVVENTTIGAAVSVDFAISGRFLSQE